MACFDRSQTPSDTFSISQPSFTLQNPPAVGLTGELPEDEEAPAPSASLPQTAEQQQHSIAAVPNQQQQRLHITSDDPTERLAIALGLGIDLLAHRRPPGARLPASFIPAAAARLRHALTHPLVDPDAGLSRDQHHTAATAASAAKRRERAASKGQGQGQQLQQPISGAVETRVTAVEGLERVAASIRGRLQVRSVIAMVLGFSCSFTCMQPYGCSLAAHSLLTRCSLAAHSLLTRCPATCHAQVLETSLLQKLKTQALRIEASTTQVQTAVAAAVAAAAAATSAGPAAVVGGAADGGCDPSEMSVLAGEDV
jgi:hypothetical protein